MIELDGRQYVVKTAQENTQDMLNRINDYCTANDIRNSKNEVMYIAETPTNPLYIILWALGYLVAILQKLIYNLACAFSIPNASDKQLLNLADIANVKRRSATKTTIDVLIYAALNASCTVTTEDTVTVNNVVFRPAFNLVIEQAQVGHIILVADTYGAVIVSEDTITDFDTPLEGLRTLKQYASIPGQEEESMSSLRERMQRRTYSGTALDAAQDAILALPGVTTCSIYFNSSPSAEAIINGIHVRAREALLLIQGYSSDIAKTFYQHLTCNTTDAGVERTTQQNYITHANQSLPVYIVAPAQVDCYVHVYITSTIDEATVLAMKDAIMSLCTVIKTGQSVTSAMILDVLDEFKSYGLQGALLSDDNTQFDFKVDPQIDELLVIKSENIEISMPGVLT